MKEATREMLPIPVEAAASIAEAFGYDQVVIVARRVGSDPAPHGEHCTTFGGSKAHADVAARIGVVLQREVMQWTTKAAEGERLYAAWVAQAERSFPEELEPASLSDALSMIETWTAETFPADQAGRVHFGRAMLESVAASIKAHLSAGGAGR